MIGSPSGGGGATQAPDSPLWAIAELARIDFSRHDLGGVLGQVAALAQKAAVGDGEASVTLLRGSAAYTAVFTGQAALSLDETQYEEGHGPCLDAAAAGETLLIQDMATEIRWPVFTKAALAAGMGSSLSLALPLQEGVTGALNLYSRAPAHFPPELVELGSTFAAYAAVAVGNAHLYDDAATEARHMRAAMEHRAVVEQAKGIIMGERRCSPQSAFAVLRELSNTTNRKLHEVARALVEAATGGPTD
jgi:GAF domain-containing protein